MCGVHLLHCKGALMCSDTAWSIPCCAPVCASISVEGPLSAVAGPLGELGDGITKDEPEESEPACTYRGGLSQHLALAVPHTILIEWPQMRKELSLTNSERNQSHI